MQTMRDPLQRALLIGPDREAFVDGDRRVTFGDFDDRLQRLQTLLRGFGLDAGDRVGIIAFNSLPFAELYCGVPMSRMVQVPLNFRWADPELEYALHDSGARVLFCDRDPGQLAGLVERVVRIDTGEYDELLEACAPTPFSADQTHENDLAGLFYTGGTTGASKGVMLTHRNLIANALNVQFIQPMTPDDRYIVMAPMFHAAGSLSVLQSLFVGAAQVLVDVFDPVRVLDLIERERVTQTLAVPTMVAALVEEQLARPRDVSTLQVMGHGGSPIATEVVRRGAVAFPTTDFFHAYGATETSPGVSGLRGEVGLLDCERGRSVGRPLIGCSVVIRDRDGNELAAGEAGEVTVRGANVMTGYWNKPEQTSQALRDGWYWTGDVGRLDDEGFLYLLDRSKDMIISGGENVYCSEVEDAIYRHPAVLEATVFGIPDDAWGEAVHAVVVLRDGHEASDADIIAHCRSQIAGYKTPKSIEFRADALPKSGPGKVLKRELREPYWADRDRSIN